jgi:[CysO sulfur-carrier protein]-S-L-cysteine hydrolase
MNKELILLNNSHLNALTKLAISSLPNESCAILLGKRVDTKSIVNSILPMNNSLHSSVAFNINPDDLYNAYNTAKLLELDVISIFHSHPSKLLPSKTDQIFMMLNPVIWIIYSTSLNNFKAFILHNFDQFKEISIRVIKD